MTQHYSNPERESDPHALPDIETFYWRSCYIRFGLASECGRKTLQTIGSAGHCVARCDHSGWYWWTCSPGCLPDGEPNGPFDTEQEALADAQAGGDL